VHSLLTPLVLLVLAAPPARWALVQVGPSCPPGYGARTPGQERAVILIHGLGLHPFNKSRVQTPALRSWQEPTSALVRHLVPHADVYAFCYVQNAPVEQLVEHCRLPDVVRFLRNWGYREVVLVGHSAGGLLARHLVEDYPEAGATKVIQVCAPNAGSSWAAVPVGIPYSEAHLNQLPFLASLTCSSRQRVLHQRVSRRVPPGVEFACVIGSCRVGGDGLVLGRSQWTEDLQEQGVPAFPVRVTHWDAMMTNRTAELIAGLVRTPVPRWTSSQVDQARKSMLGP
jgi:pimeloyl-ACP methyl ester carboxylesterase